MKRFPPNLKRAKQREKERKKERSQFNISAIQKKSLKKKKKSQAHDGEHSFLKLINA